MSKKKNLSILKKIVVLFAVCTLLLSAFALPSFAEVADDPENVTRAAEGVFLIMYCEPDPDDKHEALSWSIGSGFLINEDTVVTCYHVIHPGVTSDGSELVAYLKDKYGSNWENKMEIRVYYQAGNFVTASEIKAVANSEADYTAIKLSQKLSGRRVLTLNSDIDNKVKSPDVVHALGYPYDLTFYEDHNTSSYTSKDVDTRTGNVNKLAYVNGVRTINHSATLFSGMSGGPLVDAAGNVIGINAMAADKTYNYSISIDTLITSLDTLAIPYTTAEITEVTTETEPVSEDSTTEVSVDRVALSTAILQASTKEEKAYTADSFAALKTALSEAESVKANADASQADIDAAEQKLKSAMSGLVEASSAPIGLIIGIVGAVIAIIVIVVIIVLVSRKGKGSAEPEYAQGPRPAAPIPPVPPTGVQGGFKPAPSNVASDFSVNNYSNSGSAETGVLSSSSETTVLSAGSNETTVLSSKPYATLTRKSNNETVKVAAAKFVIGKERSKVNYCIDGNGAVSRTHAQIVKSGSTVNLVDLGSKNGTFLNGVRCDSNVPTAIKSGDKIVLADEEFVISLL